MEKATYDITPDKFKYLLWLRLWVWWLGLTILYLLLFTISKTGSIFGYIQSFIGFFVPFGFYNLFAVFTYSGEFFETFVYGNSMIPDKDGFFGLLALATIPLALFAIFYGEKISKKYKFSNRNKIIFNLIILFLLTILIDLLLYQKLATLEYFIQGGGKIRLLG